MTAGPIIHSVHIYDEHSTLIGRLCGIVKTALQLGGSVLIVATEPHRDALVRELTDAGVDVREQARQGTFRMYDASETLASFMVKGKPDRKRFLSTLGKILEDCESSRKSQQQLTVFGEMVALLWADGKRDAALKLERLWNDVLDHHVFHLHCAYPRWSFEDSNDEVGLAAVCHQHSHVWAH
ncbi:MAG: hypothetical protein NVS9B15_03320 [Acidobacteriaceae bacterium]